MNAAEENSILASGGQMLRSLFALAAALFSLATMAQPFPSRPVTLVVPFSPGTGIDILARVIGPPLAEKWGQPVVVENKPGASGNIGTDFVAKSAPDGYTLLVTVNTFAITPTLIKSTAYDVVRDFSPLSKIATATYCFAVNPNVFPANNMSEAIALIRKNPGKYFFASPGNGTPHHIGMELIKLRLGLDLTHVPYKGFAGAMQDLVGGQVQMMFTLVHSAIPQVRAGRIKILGVTGAQRSPQFPEAPTFREQGIDFMDDVDAWYAVLGPAKLAPELVAKLNGDVNAVMALPAVKENLLRQGLIPATSTPQELGALVKSDLQRWAKVIAEAKITAD
jgi:tripartite-type tricarboxylate transporter receptor subunit TctC